MNTRNAKNSPWQLKTTEMKDSEDSEDSEVIEVVIFFSSLVVPCLGHPKLGLVVDEPFLATVFTAETNGSSVASQKLRLTSSTCQREV